MKTCCKCKTEKTLVEFGNNKSRFDGKQSYCKLCAKGYNSAHYSKHPEKRKDLNERAKKKAQQFIWDYLKQNSCVDCPESDPIVLQFDHVRGKKLFNLSEAAASGYSISKIMDEIAKCEVRCANCHLRQTASRGNWYSLIDM